MKKVIEENHKIAADFKKKANEIYSNSLNEFDMKAKI